MYVCMYIIYVYIYTCIYSYICRHQNKPREIRGKSVRVTRHLLTTQSWCDQGGCTAKRSARPSAPPPISGVRPVPHTSHTHGGVRPQPADGGGDAEGLPHLGGRPQGPRGLRHREAPPAGGLHQRHHPHGACRADRLRPHAGLPHSKSHRPGSREDVNEGMNCCRFFCWFGMMSSHQSTAEPISSFWHCILQAENFCAFLAASLLFKNNSAGRVEVACPCGQVLRGEPA